MALRRLVLVVSLVFGGSLAMAAAGIAAGGGLGPGNHVFTNISADAEVGMAKGGPPDQKGISLFVNRGLNSYRPAGQRGPGTVTTSTMVQLSVFDSTGSTFGCFEIPPADFTVGSDLQTASLHTTLTVSNMCAGVGAPVTGGSDITPLAGGGGLPLPIMVDVTWTGNGVISTGNDHSTFQCLDYSTRLSSVSHASLATAAGSLTGPSGASQSFNTDLANVSSTDTNITVNGILPTTCLGA